MVPSNESLLAEGIAQEIRIAEAELVASSRILSVAEARLDTVRSMSTCEHDWEHLGPWKLSPAVERFTCRKCTYHHVEVAPRAYLPTT